MAVCAVTSWEISTYTCTSFRAIRSFPGIKSATLTWWLFGPTVRLHRSPYAVEIFPLKARNARNASLMRVCHPSPLARSAAITSASNRTLTASLVTSFCFSWDGLGGAQQSTLAYELAKNCPTWLVPGTHADPAAHVPHRLQLPGLPYFRPSLLVSSRLHPESEDFKIDEMLHAACASMAGLVSVLAICHLDIVRSLSLRRPVRNVQRRRQRAQALRHSCQGRVLPHASCPRRERLHSIFPWLLRA